mmetsp:Transcript_4554/g.9798  ORF Transcript_4554/g.9798 Transcript_4554/m.9798 type:complete len:203 (-) Transcript_4554:1139-1747(-)
MKGANSCHLMHCAASAAPYIPPSIFQPIPRSAYYHQSSALCVDSATACGGVAPARSVSLPSAEAGRLPLPSSTTGWLLTASPGGPSLLLSARGACCCANGESTEGLPSAAEAASEPQPQSSAGGRAVAGTWASGCSSGCGSGGGRAGCPLDRLELEALLGVSGCGGRGPAVEGVEKRKPSASPGTAAAGTPGVAANAPRGAA